MSTALQQPPTARSAAPSVPLEKLVSQTLARGSMRQHEAAPSNQTLGGEISVHSNMLFNNVLQHVSFRGQQGKRNNSCTLHPHTGTFWEIRGQNHGKRPNKQSSNQATGHRTRRSPVGCTNLSVFDLIRWCAYHRMLHSWREWDRPITQGGLFVSLTYTQSSTPPVQPVQHTIDQCASEVPVSAWIADRRCTPTIQAATPSRRHAVQARNCIKGSDERGVNSPRCANRAYAYRSSGKIQYPAEASMVTRVYRRNSTMLHPGDPSRWIYLSLAPP